MNHLISFYSYKNPEKELLEEILAIQGPLIAKRNSKNLDQGFLISAFTEIELRNIIQSGGHIHVAQMNQKTIAYILTCPIREFTDLITSSTQATGTLESNETIRFGDYRYLYQIAVAKNHARKGVNTQLLAYAKTIEQMPLLTDVLISPLDNDASVQFFKKNGFNSIGYLFLSSYRDFGELKSEVLVCR